MHLHRAPRSYRTVLALCAVWRKSTLGVLPHGNDCMKIAIAVPTWPPGSNPNGIVTYSSHMVSALRGLGNEVFVLTGSCSTTPVDPHTIEFGRFMPRFTPLRRAQYKLSLAGSKVRDVSFAIAAALRMLVEEHGVEVFEMEESFGWSLASSEEDLLPVVVRLHGPWFLTGQFGGPGDAVSSNRGRAKREGRAIASAHLVTANCADTLRLVREHYGLALANSRIIPTPIDAVKEGETWSVDGCIRDSILFVGRFDKLKGGDLVLQVLERLAVTNPRARLTFVGPDRGIEATDGKFVKFEEFVQEHFSPSLRARVDFRGQMDHADVMALRRKHYLTFIGAQFDTLGYMLLEPMSIGCPVVTTAVGGIPEVIKNNQNGVLVPPQDVNAIVDACRALLDDPVRAARLGRQAWIDCRETLGSEIVALKTVDAYRVAIESHCTG